MKKVALLFPGQGSQYVGMGKELYDNFAVVRNLFEEASDAIGIDIKKLCMEENIDELTKTENSQPAILTVSYAAYKIFQQEIGLIPYYGAGHSLGEYTALACSGAIAFQDAIKISRMRGKFMQQSSALGEGIMAAVNNIDKSVVQEECRKISFDNNIVVISGYNSTGQTTISGNKNAVEQVVEVLKSFGAETVYLKVSAPFHSPLMNQAADMLREELKKYEFRKTEWPVISNVNGQPYGAADTYIENLVLQMTSPVNWLGTINYLWDNGVTKAIELGPKSVLKNLMKKNENLIETFSYDVEGDKLKIQSEFCVKENRLRLVSKCLAVVVCTKNNNWDNDEYEKGVLEPYKEIKKMKEILEQEGQEPDIGQMREAVNMLLSVFKTKGTSVEEQKERFIEIFNETGTREYFGDIEIF